MRRREFLGVIGGAVAWPAATQAQQAPMLRVGMASLTPLTSPHWMAFSERLRELGYVEGRNLTLEFIAVSGSADTDYLVGHKEVIARKVDVLVALGGEGQIKGAMAATATLPIVMVAIDYDPFALGYVKSLARPTGNVTGLFFQQIELAAKRTELMKEAFPDVGRVTVFWDNVSKDQWEATQVAAYKVGLNVFGVELRKRPYDYEAALAQVPAEYRGGFIGLTSPTFFNDRQALSQLTLRHRMASIFVFRENVDAGGLMSYGVSFSGLARRAAEYADRLARGAKPADLPIEQPTKFELVLSMKTAKALGFALPTSLMLRADEVIE
jgi:putative ABC transport system substrate-binding protein